MPEAPSLRAAKAHEKKELRPKRPASAAEQSPVGARISRRAADRLRNGHVWVYASDVEALEPGEGEIPALLPVADNRGLLLGTALYSPSSQIALRMVAREAIGEAEWLKRLEKRLEDLILTLGQIKEENRALRQRQETLTAERAGLLQKNEQVRARVEAMIGRLKSMEQA